MVVHGSLAVFFHPSNGIVMAPDARGTRLSILQCNAGLTIEADFRFGHADMHQGAIFLSPGTSQQIWSYQLEQLQAEVGRTDQEAEQNGQIDTISPLGVGNTGILGVLEQFGIDAHINTRNQV